MLMAAIKEIYSVYMYPIPHHIPGGYINCAIYITRTSPFRHSAARKTLNGLATSFNAIYAGYFRVQRWLAPVRCEAGGGGGGRGAGATAATAAAAPFGNRRSATQTT